MDAEPGVPLLGRDLVEAIAEPPRRAAAERRDRGARPLVRHARVEAAETAVLARAHRRAIEDGRGVWGLTR